MILSLGVGLLMVTTVVHALCTVATLQMLHAAHAERWGIRSLPSQVLLVTLVVVLLFVASLLETAVWGATYVWLQAFSTWEQALYFSIVTYTTLGYGDVTLDERWRLLSSFEAANGILLFGWSTALLVTVVRRIEEGARARRHGG